MEQKYVESFQKNSKFFDVDQFLHMMPTVYHPFYGQTCCYTGHIVLHFALDVYRNWRKDALEDQLLAYCFYILIHELVHFLIRLVVRVINDDDDEFDSKGLRKNAEELEDEKLSYYL